MVTLNVATCVRTLKDLASEDLLAKKTELSHKSAQEYCGPCPGCGGKDRFIVKLDRWAEKGGAFLCRTCHPHYGDIIEYYKHYKKVQNFGKAIKLAEAYLSGGAKYVSTNKVIAKPVVKNTLIPPSSLWQEEKGKAVYEAKARLFTEDGKAVLDFLHGRGLCDEVIKNNWFGAIHSYEVQTNYWMEVTKDTWYVSIPWYTGGDLWKVNLRDITAVGDDPRYKAVTGSARGLYNADALEDNPRPTFIVEGEFNASIIEQVAMEMDELINVVAIGSNTGARNDLWVMRLAAMPVCFIALDADDKSDKVTFWDDALASRKPIRWRPVGAKDTNDMYRQDPASVKIWIEAALESWRSNMLHRVGDFKV